MLIVSGRITFGSVDAAEALALAVPAIAHTRDEAGCIAYHVSVDPLEPSVLNLFEHWEDVEALTTHLTQPYVSSLRQELDALGERDANMTRFEAVPTQFPTLPR